jgi:hypothetical protein
MSTLTDRAGNTVAATRISCDCTVCKGVAVLVPSGMLARKDGKTLRHNLVAQRKLFGYPTVD